MDADEFVTEYLGLVWFSLDTCIDIARSCSQTARSLEVDMDLGPIESLVSGIDEKIADLIQYRDKVSDIVTQLKTEQEQEEAMTVAETTPETTPETPVDDPGSEPEPEGEEVDDDEESDAEEVEDRLTIREPYEETSA